MARPVLFLFFALVATAACTALEPAFDRFAGEVARINREREEERKEKEMMARAHLSKGNALANELSSKSERRRMLQMREQELFAQWTSTQKKLEAQAKGMMEELGSATTFVTDTRKSLEAAKSERAAQLQRADDIDQQRRRLMEKRRDLLQERALIASQLETLSGNLTVLDAAKQRALQTAVQQADTVAQEEAQLASLESESSKERGELWNLDVRLHTLQTRLNQTLAAAPPPVAVPSPTPEALVAAPANASSPSNGSFPSPAPINASSPINESSPSAMVTPIPASKARVPAPKGVVARLMRAYRPTA